MKKLVCETFEEFKLMEGAEKRIEYGCAMLEADVSTWKEDHLSIVDEKDIYDNDDNEYGYCDHPHMTLLYGIHPDEVTLDEISEAFEAVKPMNMTIDKISIFETDDKDYDVVKYDVPVTDELKEYHDMFEEFPNTQDFPEYHPHMTLAYVKKGEGKKYTQGVEPFEVTFNEGTYSVPDEEKQHYDLIDDE